MVKKLKKAKLKGQNSRKIERNSTTNSKNPGKNRKMNQNNLETQEKVAKTQFTGNFFAPSCEILPKK